MLFLQFSVNHISSQDFHNKLHKLGPWSTRQRIILTHGEHQIKGHATVAKNVKFQCCYTCCACHKASLQFHCKRVT